MKVVSKLSSADRKSVFYFVFCAMLLGLCAFAQAQQAKIYRIGVITSGGGWYATIDGLRAGLKELGVQEGKQFILTIRDTKGDARAAEAAAKVFEQERST